MVKFNQFSWRNFESKLHNKFTLIHHTLKWIKYNECDSIPFELIEKSSIMKSLSKQINDYASLFKNENENKEIPNKKQKLIVNLQRLLWSMYEDYLNPPNQREWISKAFSCN